MDRASMKSFLVLSILSCVLLRTAFAITDNLSYPVENLPSYQIAEGGFRALGTSTASLPSTADGLFLAALYGQRHQLNLPATNTFIRSCQNSNGAYGYAPGLPSTLEHTKDAILAYHYLGEPVPSVANLVSFVSSLLDAKTSLFSNQDSSRPSLKATVTAFEILELLGEIKRDFVRNIHTNLQQYLIEHAKLSGEHKYFDFTDEELDLAESQYYGVILGRFVELDDLSDGAKYANFILSRQAPRTAPINELGGFYGSGNEVTAQSSYFSVAALSFLGSSYLDKIDIQALRYHLGRLDVDLETAAYAHAAIALTPAFSNNFEVQVGFDTVEGAPVKNERVIQGTQIRPRVAVLAFGQFPHQGMEVALTYKFGDKAAVSTTLQPAGDRFYTSAEYINTADELGLLNIGFVMRQFVAGLGDLSFTERQALQVGYGISVGASATHEATGRVIAEGESVSLGTSFQFDVTLRTAKQESFVSGPFDVIFSVFDASKVTIHQHRLDCRTNKAPIRFSYNFQNANLPDGEISFEFSIRDDNGIIHTTSVVSYPVSIPMIATNIQFEGVAAGEEATYKLGNTVKISMSPASFHDLRSPLPYDVKDFQGNDATLKRIFKVDIATPAGTILDSVTGVPRVSGGNTVYDFEIPVEATLDSAGSHSLSFRYVSNNEKSHPLQNYDSATGELLDDSYSIKYTVSTKFEMTHIIEQPQSVDFSYGSDVNFRFKITDSVSKQDVLPTANSKVVLLLNHHDESRNKDFNSARVDASVDGDDIVIRWQISPNAIKGSGFLSIIVVNADSEESPIFKEGTTNPVNYPVKIGGEIEIKHKQFESATTHYPATTFVAELGLECQGKPLTDAKLISIVEYGNNNQYSERLRLPVATNGKGKYSVSWTSPHHEAPSGTYRVKIFRETDRQKALEEAQLKEKERLKNRRERELKGETVEPESDSKELELNVDPLQVIEFKHVEAKVRNLPIRIELLIFLAFFGVFVLSFRNRKQYLTL